MLGNCLLFVVGRYLKRGGYIVIHRSDYGWWPHAVWSGDLKTFEQFHPVKHRRWYARILRWHLPPPLFDGRAHPWSPK
jgi:hypothetical protein